MKKALLLLSLIFITAGAQAQAACPPAGMTQIATGLTATTFTDTTVVNSTTYNYVTSANNSLGAACSAASNNVTIPATGTHTVALSWTASTTPGVTYAVFRASSPTPPGTPTATVN